MFLVSWAITVSNKPSGTGLDAAIVGAALAIAGATVSLVSFSVSRQEHLSGRTRALAQEFRKLGRVASPSAKQRRDNVAEQIRMFNKRLQDAVRGHIYLYVALLLEVIVSWVALIGRLFSEFGGWIWLVNGFLLVAAYLIVRSLCLHIREYGTSDTTMCKELEDVFVYLGARNPAPENWREHLFPHLLRRRIRAAFKAEKGCAT